MWTGRLVVAGATALALAASGCAGPGATDDGTTSVVVGFYPLQFLAERVGGSFVQVASLAQPGAEPHDLELRPQQIQLVAEADLVLYLAEFQPAVDDAVAQNAADSAYDVLRATDVLAGYAALGHEDEGDDEHGDAVDPHVWLDPTRYAELAGALAQRLAELDPDHAAGFRDAAAVLTAELTALDEEYVAGLTGCARREIVTTHNAFGYLADRYDLEQVGIAGLSPEDEPSPQDLQEVSEFVRANEVTTIFYEDAVSPEYAETVAAEVGADTAVLSPVEVVDDGEDYLSVMRANLAVLQEALDCP